VERDHLDGCALHPYQNGPYSERRALTPYVLEISLENIAERSQGFIVQIEFRKQRETRRRSRKRDRSGLDDRRFIWAKLSECYLEGDRTLTFRNYPISPGLKPGLKRIDVHRQGHIQTFPAEMTDLVIMMYFNPD
jgi:hypothetical protein